MTIRDRIFRTLGRLGGLATLATALLGPTPAAAQQAGSYPERPITILVGFPPGGAFDSVMRSLAEELTRTLGQRVNVENRAGAGGALATQAAIAAPADGYTLLTAGLQLATGPHLNKVGYNPQADLTMIGQVSNAPVLMLVRGDSPVRHARDLVALGQRGNRGLMAGSGGIGTTGHFGTLMLGETLRTPVVHVPFKGGAAGLQALVGGEIDLMFDQSSSVMQGLLQSGKLRVVAVMQDQRATALPEVPSAREFGLALPAPLRGWQGLAVRSGTPAAVTARLSSALAQAVASPGFRARLNQLGLEAAAPNTPATFQQFYLSELDRWGAFIRQHRITTE